MKLMDKLPTFFLLGAAKSGTSSLYSYLNQHPQIYFPSYKEPHFFDGTIYECGADWYIQNYFKHADAYLARGDATPVLHLPHITVQRIAQTYGQQSADLKFIVVLRDPVDRAWSHYLHRTRVMVEDKAFPDALSCENARLQKNPNAWVGYFRDGLYAKQLSAWFQQFDRKQFTIFLHEDLSDSSQVVDATLEHIGVDTSVNVDTSFRSNVAAQPRNKQLMRFLNEPPKLVQLFGRTILQPSVRKQIRLFLRQKNSKPLSNKPMLDPVTASELRLQYRQDIRRLEDLIKRDLSAWYVDRC